MDDATLILGGPNENLPGLFFSLFSMPAPKVELPMHSLDESLESFPVEDPNENPPVFLLFPAPASAPSPADDEAKLLGELNENPPMLFI